MLGSSINGYTMGTRKKAVFDRVRTGTSSQVEFSRNSRKIRIFRLKSAVFRSFPD